MNAFRRVILLATTLVATCAMLVASAIPNAVWLAVLKQARVHPRSLAYPSASSVKLAAQSNYPYQHRK